MRIVFFGTPSFAVPSLRNLVAQFEVVAVVCQPDRPKGRGRRLTAPPVKALAVEKRIEVLQPRKVRTTDFRESIARLEPDVAVVVAYGRILPPAILALPRAGCVNVHASLLPRWRGAAPIQWAVTAGDEETGVTLMKMDEGLDTGPVYASERTTIREQETAGELSERLSVLGANLLVDKLAAIVEGRLVCRPQSDSGITLARPLTKEDGSLDFFGTAKEVVDRVRGMNPWPGAFSFLEGQRFRIHRASVAARASAGEPPGTVLHGDALHVSCAAGVVSFDEVQLDGKKSMPVGQFLRGHSVEAGLRFGPK